LFADAGSVTPKSNPFNTDANGYGSFYVVDGRYRIQATDIDWRNEDLIGQSVSNHVALPDPHSQYTTAAEVNAEFNQFGVGAAGRGLANADNAVLGSNNATGFDDNTAAVSGNYPDVGISSGSGPVWWNLVTYGTSGRTTQVATEVYGLGGRPKGETFTRVKHDTWEPWVNNFTGGGAITASAITASATFTNSTNNIALTGIGSIGLEIGDVVQVTGTASNNKLFTVEVITDNDNVVVNQAHAGGTTTKSLVDETVSATVTLLAKWFNASPGLGQGIVDVTSLRAFGVVYTGIPNRQIFVMVSEGSATTNRKFFIDGEQVFQGSTSGSNDQLLSVIIPAGSTYEFRVGQAFPIWSEVR
jgi:hypothetical protein